MTEQEYQEQVDRLAAGLEQSRAVIRRLERIINERGIPNPGKQEIKVPRAGRTDRNVDLDTTGETDF